MNVSSVGASAYAALATGTGAGASAPASGTSAPAGSNASSQESAALQYLENYLKETPAQRMEDAWLAKHHLTEASLAALPPAQQDAIKKQMAEDIRKEMQEKTGGKTGAIANLTA